MTKAEQDAFLRDLQELENGTLTAAKREELVNLLQHSKFAKRLYLEYFEQAALIAFEARAQQESEELSNCIEFSALPRRKGKWPRLAATAGVTILLVLCLFAYKTFRSLPPHQKAQISAGALWSVDGKSSSTPPGNHNTGCADL